MNSTAIEKLTTYYGYTYLIPPICIFGIICNLINLSVLTNAKLRESPYTYLTGLACCDILTLLSSFTITFTRGIWFEPYKTVTVHYWLKSLERKLFLPIANIFSALSVIITIALTIERYIFIKSPMKASAFCSPKYARKIIITIFLLVCLFRLPMFFFWSIYLIDVKSIKNETAHSIPAFEQFNCEIKLVKNYEEFQKFYFMFSFFIFEIIPFFILLIFNINLIILVKKSNNEFLSLRNNQAYTSPNVEISEAMSTNTRQINFVPTAIALHSKTKSTDSLELNNVTHYSFHSLRNIKRGDSRHSNMTKRKRDELKLTRTLISLLFLALLSEISSIITYDKITEFLIGKHFKNYMETTYKLQVFVSNMIILTLHSMNFFLFCAFNKKYNFSLRQQYSRYLNKLCCKFKIEDQQFN